MPTTRTTKYTQAVREYMSRVGHATNLDIQRELQKTYPELSATTIHRITARLYEQKLLQLVPFEPGGSMHYDANLGLHDHFYCTRCKTIKDLTIPRDIFESLGTIAEGNIITERLAIMGTCSQCSTRSNK
jgi:Fur family peroxide stress response transcriptional regulator